MATLPRITYPDKVDYQINGKDSKYGISAQDMNEIKETFNQSADGIEKLMNQNQQIEQGLNDVINDLNSKIENGQFIPNITIGEVVKGEEATVAIRGTKESPILDMVLPKGDIGPVGPKGDVGPIGPQGIQGPKGDGILTPHIVTELPTVGGNSDIYFVVDGDSYISYMYVEDKWISIGSGNVDLSNYYTKDETKEIANLRIKGYSAKTEETSLLQTLTIAYKNEVKNNNDGDAIEKVFLLGLESASDNYDLMGLEKTRYVVLFFQFPRKQSNIYFTFAKINQSNKNEKYYIDLKTDANDNVVILSDNSVRKVKLIDEFGEAINQFKTDYIIDSEGNIMIGKGQNETNVGVDSRTTVLRGSAVNVKRVSGSQATWEEIVSSKDVTTIKKITLAQYNALSAKDSKTLYLVVG